MSGPVASEDAPEHAAPAPPEAATVEIAPSRSASVGGLTVRRALPRRERRSVGAWCFLDHFGPASLDHGDGMLVGPHPHTGLQTVTWLVSGEVLHRDSLGSEQLIRPGQLNLMTAGRGIAHAEETPTGGGAGLHGAQLWVALPEATRDGEAAFEHHAELPRVALGRCVATVLLGEFAGERSPARADTRLAGVELAMPGGEAVLPLDPAFEHALVVLDGAASVGVGVVEPGALCYLGLGRGRLELTSAGPARALLVGGVPFPDPLHMWWNFVARSRADIDVACREWNEGADRFGEVASQLPRIPAPPPPW
ncbi:MAG TPA: pirin family protein [Candidatus Dormibacteraeota bacterium]|nr:pirin family protein [Candidatus Dormibacteraeota bacterium]